MVRTDFLVRKKHKNSGYVRMREIKKGARGINHAGRNEKKKFNCTGTSDGNDEYCSFTGNYRNGNRNRSTESQLNEAKKAYDQAVKERDPAQNSIQYCTEKSEPGK